MKQIIALLTATRFLTCLVSLIMFVFSPTTEESSAYQPGAGFKGSPHDISSMINIEDAGREGSCRLCHVPKDGSVASSDLKDYPLWNIGAGPKKFESYNSGLWRTSTGRSPVELLSTQPGSISKFCLGCHDGTLGVNSYGIADIGNPRVINAVNSIFNSSPSKVIGGGFDLSNHHPIGFDYDAVRAVDSAVAPLSYRLGSKSIGDLLNDGRMECTTCHSVHNVGNTGEKLLWVSDRNSSLCLGCHLMQKMLTL